MPLPPTIIPKLQAGSAFPDPAAAVRGGRLDGLVAVGGDLSAARLLSAYRNGIFPWTDKPITWWSPDPRAVLEPDGLRIPRSLARLLRRDPFEITVNRAFEAVITACAEPAPGREETWITPGFVTAYTRLHRQGHAHSLECWQQGRLVGGVYGVAVGGLFAGESMFHRADNASKVALCHLARRLKDRGYALFDVQVPTPVTLQLGAVLIPRADYLRRLADAVELKCRFA